MECSNARFWPHYLDLWPTILAYELDLDILTLDLHAKIQVCMSIRSAGIARRTDRHTDQGRREKVHGRYASPYRLDRKLSPRAFQRYMTTLYCSIIIGMPYTVWKLMSPAFQRYANVSLRTYSRRPCRHTHIQTMSKLLHPSRQRCGV